MYDFFADDKKYLPITSKIVYEIACVLFMAECVDLLLLQKTKNKKYIFCEIIRDIFNSLGELLKKLDTPVHF